MEQVEQVIWEFWRIDTPYFRVYHIEIFARVDTSAVRLGSSRNLSQCILPRLEVDFSDSLHT